MKCPKCNREMKEYVGLRETGWDCINSECGKNEVTYKWNILEIEEPSGPTFPESVYDAVSYNNAQSHFADAIGYLSNSIGTIVEWKLSRLSDETDEQLRIRLNLMRRIQF